jgi:hypothetical protein
VVAAVAALAEEVLVAEAPAQAVVLGALAPAEVVPVARVPALAVRVPGLVLLERAARAQVAQVPRVEALAPALVVPQQAQVELVPPAVEQVRAQALAEAVALVPRAVARLEGHRAEPPAHLVVRLAQAARQQDRAVRPPSTSQASSAPGRFRHSGV